MAGPDRVDFVEHRLPPLESGTYTITAKQTINATDLPHLRFVPPTTFDAPVQHLFVAGPRHDLSPQMVAGVFPPRGSLGDHTSVLPHIRLQPDTLPWLRSARLHQDGDDEDTLSLIARTPWLALLLFDTDEAPEVTAVRLADLNTTSAAMVELPSEPGDHPEDLVSAIDVGKGVLTGLLPRIEELASLAHVRERLADHAVTDAAAVVVGNRLPLANRSSTVHLVSLEHRVVRDPDWRYHFHDLDDDAPVRLVSLHHWSFTCASPTHSFHGLAASLDRSPSSLRLPTEEGLRGRVSVDDRGALQLTSDLGTIEGRYGTDGTTQTIVDDPGFGRALSFDGGLGDRLAVERPFSDPAQFTIAAWAKPRQPRPGTEQAICGGLDNQNGVPSLRQGEPPENLVAYARDDQGGFHSFETRGVFTTPGEWVHLAWVRTGETELLYRNGTLHATGQSMGRLPVPLHDLVIGGAGGSPDLAWDGLLADVRVYDRTLTAAEVAGLVTTDRSHQPELAGAFLSRGLVPLEHHLRQGSRTVSWYRGPLAPPDPPPSPSLLAPTVSGPPMRVGQRPRHADGYLEYYADVGMFDASYAVAWELGRHLMLANRSQALAVYSWKRLLRQHRHRTDTAATTPNAQAPGAPPELPTGVVDFFRDLTQLKAVPASYLLPDPDLLPPESLRFCQMDSRWVEALIDGALSIGNQTSFDANRVPRAAEMPEIRRPSMYGVLIRSDLVASWPKLMIEGHRGRHTTDDEIDTEPLRMVRRTEITTGVLLCLFAERPLTLDVHLAPEEIHCGFDVDDGGGFSKVLREVTGQLADRSLSAIPTRSPGPLGPGGVVDIAGMVAQMTEALQRDLTTADVALQMTVGVPKVRFVLDTP